MASIFLRSLESLNPSRNDKPLTVTNKHADLPSARDKFGYVPTMATPATPSTTEFITITRNAEPTGITFPFTAEAETRALSLARAACDAWRRTRYVVVGWRGVPETKFRDGELIALPSGNMTQE